MVKKALLIGVSEYEAGLAPLSLPVNDVQAIRELLIDPDIGEFLKSDVKVLTNPKRQEMSEEIESLFTECGKDDLILLFFSGHGIKDDMGQLYLSTRETRKTPEGRLVLATSISSRVLHESMEGSRCKRQIVILDSCFSGAFAKGMSAKDDGTVDIRGQLGGEGRVILASSSSTQLSYEDKRYNLSLYTHFLVEGIRTGEADKDQDGRVSANELHEYASQKVREIRPDMTPKIFPGEEGYKIILTKVPCEDPLQKYREEVRECIRAGEISSTNRRILKLKRSELGVEISQALEIEEEEIAPYRLRLQRNHEEYEQAFSDVYFQCRGVIGEEDRNDLLKLKRRLEITSEFTQPIEERVIDQFKVYEQRLQDNKREYEQAIRDAVQYYVYPFNEICDELKHLQQCLNLSNEEVSEIEKRVTDSHISSFKSRIIASLKRVKKIVLQIPLGYSNHQVILGSTAIGIILTAAIWHLKPSTNPWGNNPNPPSVEQIDQTQVQSSFGSQILFDKESRKDKKSVENTDFEDAKRKGVSAMARRDYKQAVVEFTNAINKYRNAPETLIYLNNAQIGLEKSYVIAVPVPIGGPKPERAAEMLRGFAQAQHEINQNGGINGVKLKLKIFDDKDDVNIAKKVALSIVQDSEILAVMGHWSSGTSIAVAPIYNGKITLITPISTAMKLVDSDANSYIFRTNANTRTGGRALADYAINKLKVTNIAIFYDSTSPYSNELESAFRYEITSNNNSRIIKKFNLSDPSLNPENSVDRLISDGTQAILLIPDPKSVETAMKVVNHNRRRSYLIGDMANLNILEVLTESAVDMVFAPSWTITGDPDSEFSRNSKNLWNADVNWATAMSYNAAEALIEALRRQKNSSRVEIKEILQSSTFFAKGVSGEIKFSGGDANTPVQLVEVRPATPSRSRTGYDFLPIPENK